MGDSEYRAAAKYLAKLHSTEVKETGLFCINKLKKDKYGGSSISGKLKDDCNKLNCHKLSNYEEKLKKIAKYIQGALYENKWWHYKDLVYSHGDFKPDNFVFYYSRIKSTQSTNCNNSKSKINIGVIDWIDFGLRPRQYDVGSLLFGIQNPDKLSSLLNLYLKEANFEVADRVGFLKEAMALACIVHINSPLKRQTQQSLAKAVAYIDYTQKILEDLDKNGA